MKDYFGYSDKVCVVTGGSNGMGKCVVDMLLDLGAKVYVLDVLPTDNKNVEFIKVDLSERASIDEAFAKLPKTFDKFFGIAGVTGIKMSAEFTFRVNTLAGKYMLENHLLNRITRGGAIGFITSGASRGWGKTRHEYEPIATGTYEEALKFIELNKENFIEIAAYSISKRAMTYVMVSNITRYWDEKEIRINSIGPNFTRTRIFDEFKAGFMNNDPAMVAMSYGCIKRDGYPEDMAPPLVFLCSDMAGFIDGHHLYLDGGYAALSDLGALPYDTSLPYFANPVVPLP